MSPILESVYTIFNQILYAVKSIGFFDVVDILIMTFIIYKAVGFFKGTRAGQLVKGIVLLICIYLLSLVLDLVCVKWMLSKVFDWAIIAIAIVFQPEIRRALERMGRSTIGTFGKSGSDDNEELHRAIDEICQAANSMHDQKIGALIVFERTTQLGEIINTGTLLNARASRQMVENIFYPKSPLHDGALIVRDGKLYAAGCILPLTSNTNVSSKLGTRHRAAIGMSENSDSAVVVVSEESGNISLVVNGEIKSGYDIVTLKNALYGLTVDENQKSEDDTFFNKFKNIFASIGKKFEK